MLGIVNLKILLCYIDQTHGVLETVLTLNCFLAVEFIWNINFYYLY